VDTLAFNSWIGAEYRIAALASKKTVKGVDMEAFVGNTHGFAESGWVYWVLYVFQLTLS